MSSSTQHYLQLVEERTREGVTTITFVHYNIHRGITYESSYKTLTLANNASLEMLFTTGSLPCHAVFKAEIGGDGEVQLYEATTVSANGTAMARNNKNRTSSRVALATVFHTPTVTGDGTELTDHYIPGGTGSIFSGGGEDSFGREWLLAPNTNYMLRLTNRAGSTQPAGFHVQWYEKGR